MQKRKAHPMPHQYPTNTTKKRNILPNHRRKMTPLPNNRVSRSLFLPPSPFPSRRRHASAQADSPFTPQTSLPQLISPFNIHYSNFLLPPPLVTLLSPVFKLHPSHFKLSSFPPPPASKLLIILTKDKHIRNKGLPYESDKPNDE